MLDTKTKPTPEQIKAVAQRAKYTKRVFCAGAGRWHDHSGYVQPFANLKRNFTLIDDKDGTIYNLIGSRYQITDITEGS